jgi:hypothetical protein
MIVSRIVIDRIYRHRPDPCQKPGKAVEPKSLSHSKSLEKTPNSNPIDQYDPWLDWYWAASPGLVFRLYVPHYPPEPAILLGYGKVLPGGRSGFLLVDPASAEGFGSIWYHLVIYLLRLAFVL